MAFVGLSTFLHGAYDEEKGTYAKPQKLAGAIEMKESLDRNDAKLYADNELKDSDTSITGGKLSLTIDDDDEEKFAPILGRQVRKRKVDGEMITFVASMTDDEPTAQGFGLITKKNGGRYRAVFYPKVKFAMGDEEAKSGEEKTEYTKPTVEGTLYPVNGLYKDTATVNSLEAAIKVLHSYFGASPEGETAGSEGDVQADEAVEAGDDELEKETAGTGEEEQGEKTV